LALAALLVQLLVQTKDKTEGKAEILLSSMWLPLLAGDTVKAVLELLAEAVLGVRAALQLQTIPLVRQQAGKGILVGLPRITAEAPEEAQVAAALVLLVEVLARATVVQPVVLAYQVQLQAPQ
jgi:hypothetical protein